MPKIFTWYSLEGEEKSYVRWEWSGAFFIAAKIPAGVCELHCPKDGTWEYAELPQGSRRFVNVYVNQNDVEVILQNRWNAECIWVFLEVRNPAGEYYVKRIDWKYEEGLAGTANGTRHLFDELKRNACLEVIQLQCTQGNLYGRFFNLPDASEKRFLLIPEEYQPCLGAIDMSKIQVPFELITSEQAAQGQLIYQYRDFSVYGDGSKSYDWNTAPQVVEAMLASGFQPASYDRAVCWNQVNVSYDTIRQFQGMSRGVTQNAVLGCSANAIAEKAGMRGKFEWLHLCAHRFGPPSEWVEGTPPFATPQDARNLVFGTVEANTQMLVLESAITQVVQKYDLAAHVVVQTKPAQGESGRYQKNVASSISYNVMVLTFSDEESRTLQLAQVVFSPTSTYQPSLIEYLLNMETFKKDCENLCGAQVRLLARRAAPKFSIGGVAIENAAACVVRDRKLVPKKCMLEAGSRLYASDEGGDEAFTAQVEAFGMEAAPVRAALLNDGRKKVIFDEPLESFGFGDLFRDFECENLDMYAFRKVTLGIHETPERPGETAVSFSGSLDMERQVLREIRRFLGTDEELLLSGKIYLYNQNISEKVEATQFVLSSGSIFQKQITDTIRLRALSLKVMATRKIDLIKMKRGWTLIPSIRGELAVGGIGEGDTVFVCDLSYHEGMFLLSGENDRISDFLGIKGFDIRRAAVQMAVGESQKELSLQADFAFGDIILEAAGMISSHGSGVVMSFPYFSAGDVAELYQCIFHQELKVPEYNISFSDVWISAASAPCSIGGKTLEEGFRLSFVLAVHEYICEAQAVFSDKGVGISAQIGETEIGSLVLHKASLSIEMSKEEVHFTIYGAAQIEGMEAECEVTLEYIDGEWVILAAAGLSCEYFSLSKFVPAVKDSIIDDLAFSKLAIVYANRDTRRVSGEEVKKGLQLLGTVESVPGLSDLIQNRKMGLSFQLLLGAKPQFWLQSSQQSLQLGSGVSCEPFKIRIETDPAPSFALVFGIEIAVPGQEERLHFDLLLDIGALSAEGSATMKNWWENPFGIQGLRIGPAAALQIKIIYEQFLATGTISSFAIAGGCMIGETVIDMAVSISENPSEELLYGKVEKVSMSDVLALVNQITQIELPEKSLPDYLDIENLELYCAPNGGHIGTLTYEPGMSFAADLILFEKRASVYACMKKTGLLAKGELEALVVGPLKVHGLRGQNLVFDFELSKEKQHIFFDGVIELFGMSRSIYADMSKETIEFYFEDKFFGLLDFKVCAKSQGSLSDLKNLDFLLYAEFDNKITEYLKTNVAGKLKEAVRVVDEEIDKAEAKVEKARQVYREVYEPVKKDLELAQEKADRYLDDCVRELEKSKDRFSKSVDEAEKNVKQAHDAYNKALQRAIDQVKSAERDYDKAMKDAENEVTRAEEVYKKALSNAEREVKKAEREYHEAFSDAQKELDAAQRDVDSLQREIDRAIRELKNMPWYDYLWKGPALSVEIAALEASWGVATGVLYTCKGVVEGVRYGGKYAAFETARGVLKAVEKGGEYLAFESAKGVLEGVRYGGKYAALESARGVLEGVKIGSEYTVWQAALKTLEGVRTAGLQSISAAQSLVDNVGRSAVYIGLETAKAALAAVETGTEAVAFGAAQAALEAARYSAEGTLKLSEYIMSHAGDLIDIRHADMSASLKNIQQGKLFDANLQMTLLGIECELHLDMNLAKTGEFIEELFVQVFEKINKIC